MKTVLVTGASSFLGYHVVKLLNQRGIRPRVLELAGNPREPLSRLDVTQCDGHLDDSAAIDAACAGADTVFHLGFKVGVGGGRTLLDEMHRVNVTGTERLLDAAAARGVTRAIVGGSALAVGVNRRAKAIDEQADWAEHAFHLPYAEMRREAEQIALARARPGFDVVSICPSFTFGPDDPVGAPANNLLERLIKGKLPITLPIGFGCLDVRDFARGAVAAAERGRSGQRYLLNGHNVTTGELLGQAAAIAGVRAPRFVPPRPLLTLAVGVVGLVSRIRRRPAPVTRHVLDVIGRYAWYDTSRARTELGWHARPLEDTLKDTIAWLRAHGR